MKKNKILSILFFITLITNVFSENSKEFDYFLKTSTANMHQIYEIYGGRYDYYRECFVATESVSNGFYWDSLIDSYKQGQLGLITEEIQKQLNSSDPTNRELGLYCLNNLITEKNIDGFKYDELINLFAQKAYDENIYVRRLAFCVIQNFFEIFQLDERLEDPKLKIDFFNKVVSNSLEDPDPFIKGYSIELLAILKRDSFTEKDFDLIKSNLKSENRNIQLSAMRALGGLEGYSESVFNIAKTYLCSNDIQDLNDGRFLLSCLNDSHFHGRFVLDYINEFFDKNEFLDDSNLLQQAMGLFLYKDLLDSFNFSIKVDVIEKSKNITLSYLDSEDVNIKEATIFLYEALVKYNQELEAASKIVKTRINDSDKNIKNAAVELLIVLVRRNKCTKFANKIAKQFLSTPEDEKQIYGLRLHHALAMQGCYFENALSDIKKLSKETTSAKVFSNIFKLAKELVAQEYNLPKITRFFEQSIIQLDNIEDRYFLDIKDMALELIKLCSVLVKQDLYPKNIVQLFEKILDKFWICSEVSYKTQELVRDLIDKEFALPEMKNFAEDSFKKGDLRPLVEMEAFLKLIEDDDCLNEIVNYVNALMVKANALSKSNDALLVDSSIYYPLKVLLEKDKAIDLAQDFLQNILSNLHMGEYKDLESECLEKALILSRLLILKNIDILRVKDIITLALKYKEGNWFMVAELSSFCCSLAEKEMAIEEVLEAAHSLLDINERYSFEIVNSISSQEKLSQKSLDIYSKIKELQSDTK